ncbi:hypothetical protein Gbfr_018_006 [Gluconobacter frateurii M-2]|nr:hypothetical protein Gbfr_018_006 [Gluconobacter frateurii M-2]
MERMGVQHQGEGSVWFAGVVVTTLKPAIWAGEHHFRHVYSRSMSGRITALPSGGRLYIELKARISTKIDSGLRFLQLCTI